MVLATCGGRCSARGERGVRATGRTALTTSGQAAASACIALVSPPEGNGQTLWLHVECF